MGRRSRKRADGPLTAPEPAAERPPPRAPRGRVDRIIARADERPKAPWHPVPLVELAVLVGIVLIVYGILNTDSPKGRVALVCGLALASLGGLDTAVREHFEGYRSHSTLLAGLLGVLTSAVLFFAKAPWIVLALAGAAVFAGAFVGFRRAFRRRTGVAFRA